MTEVLPQPCRNCDLIRLRLPNGTPLAMELEAVAAVRHRLLPGARVRVEIAAFAEAWRLFPDLAACQSVVGQMPSPLEPNAALQSSAEDEWTTAHASLTGTIQSSQWLQNSFTGDRFVHAVVANPWLTVDVVAHPSVIAAHASVLESKRRWGRRKPDHDPTRDALGLPQLGTFAAVLVWLAGRIAYVEDAEQPGDDDSDFPRTATLAEGGSVEADPVIVMTDEAGADHRFQVIDMISVDGQLYALLLYVGGPGERQDDTEDVVVMRVREENGEQIFKTIDDETELDRVLAYVDQLDDESPV